MIHCFTHNVIKLSVNRHGSNKQSAHVTECAFVLILNSLIIFYAAEE